MESSSVRPAICDSISDSLTGNSSWTRRIDYNSSGLVSDAYDARGVHTQFSYDGLNRVTTINYYLSSGPADPATPAAHYYYDSQTLPSGAPSYTHSNTTGRLLAMTYGSSTSTAGSYFAYDVMGRVTTQKQGYRLDDLQLELYLQLCRLADRRNLPLWPRAGSFL